MLLALTGNLLLRSKHERVECEINFSKCCNPPDISSSLQNINQVNLALQAAKADLTDKVGANEESITTLKVSNALLACMQLVHVYMCKGTQ